MTEHSVSAHGVDHVALAASSRVWGSLRVAERALRAALPFMSTNLLTAFGNPIAYLAAMGVGLGSIVRADVDGVRYLTFVAPALLVSTVVSTGATWGTWPVMSGFKWERNFLAAQSTPVTPGQIMLGEAIALAVRLVLQGLAFWLLGFLFGAWVSPWSWLTIPVATLAGLAFYAPLAAYSATIEDEGIQFNLIQRLIVMPMFLFAGTFFPLSAMPAYLQWVGWISPMWHGTQLARVVAYGMPARGLEIAGHLAFLVACLTVGLLVARHNFVRRMTR